MRFRLYQPEDFAALYAIEEACFQPPFRFDRRYLKRSAEAQDSATWIAEADGAMAGFAIVEWMQTTAGVSAYLQTIEVAPEFRRRGVGARLLRQVQESARSAGAATLWLHVDTQNAAAIHFYETAGFHCLGHEEHYYAPDRGARIYGKGLFRP